MTKASIAASIEMYSALRTQSVKLNMRNENVAWKVLSVVQEFSEGTLVRKTRNAMLKWLRDRSALWIKHVKLNLWLSYAVKWGMVKIVIQLNKLSINLKLQNPSPLLNNKNLHPKLSLSLQRLIKKNLKLNLNQQPLRKRVQPKQSLCLKRQNLR